jgi:hypothetical protein
LLQRHRFAHDGMKPVGRDESMLKGIHVEVPNYDGPAVTSRGFLFQHGSREQRARGPLAFAGGTHFARKMDHRKENFVPKRQSQTPYGITVAFKDGRQKTGVEASVDLNSFALTGSKLKICGFCVQRGQHCTDGNFAFGKHEHIDVIASGDILHEMRDGLVVQVPE